MSELQTKVISTTGEFHELESQWEALQSSCDWTSVFETFDWQYLWWKTYGTEGTLRLIVATKGEELVGLLPLHIQTVPVLRVPVRMLRFVGCGGDTSPDDLGPILGSDDPHAVARALADAALDLHGWDVLSLTDLQSESPFAVTIEAAAKRRLLPTVRGQSARIVYATLRPTFDEWLGTLHRDRRYRIRKARKNLHGAYPARFFVWDNEAELDVAIDRLVILHKKRWDSATEDSLSFGSTRYIEFHRSVIKACFARRRVALYCLEIAGEIAAIYYFYKFRDTVYLMQSGFDPEYGDVRPGQVLLGHIFEHAIGERYKVLDFLKGDHRYKDELADGERETVFVTALAHRPAAAVFGLRRLVAPRLKGLYLTARRRLSNVPASDADSQGAIDRRRSVS